MSEMKLNTSVETRGGLNQQCVDCHGDCHVSQHEIKGALIFTDVGVKETGWGQQEGASTE